MSTTGDLKGAVEAAYQTTDAYEVRQRTHDLYGVGAQSFAEWLVEQSPREGVRKVLDLGCGTGAFLRRLAGAGVGKSWCGMDQSEAMVNKARQLSAEEGSNIEFRRGDILSPPFPEGGFDLVCACHMLYHVSDIGEAVRQCARLLAPGGAFLATTNSRETMAPYDREVWEAVHGRFPQVRRDVAVHARFSLENGAEFMVRHFDSVALRVRRDALRFPDPAPWAAYHKSCRDLVMPPDHKDEEWAEVADVIDRVVEEQFAGGELVVPKVAGVFLCRTPHLGTD